MKCVELHHIGIGFRGQEEWQEHHDLAHERDDMRKKIKVQGLAIAQNFCQIDEYQRFVNGTDKIYIYLKSKLI
jgi:hypothetical protein